MQELWVCRHGPGHAAGVGAGDLRRDQHTMRRCLEAFIADFKHPVHPMVTDNQGGFTDRCAVDKKGKAAGKPSGRHRFDVVCRQRGIEHRLIRTWQARTNGMVECFNGRLGETIKARPAMPGRGGKEELAADNVPGGDSRGRCQSRFGCGCGGGIGNGAILSSLFPAAGLSMILPTPSFSTSSMRTTECSGI